MFCFLLFAHKGELLIDGNLKKRTFRYLHCDFEQLGGGSYKVFLLTILQRESGDVGPAGMHLIQVGHHQRPVHDFFAVYIVHFTASQGIAHRRPDFCNKNKQICNLIIHYNQLRHLRVPLYWVSRW